MVGALRRIRDAARGPRRARALSSPPAPAPPPAARAPDRGERPLRFNKASARPSSSAGDRDLVRPARPVGHSRYRRLQPGRAAR